MNSTSVRTPDRRHSAAKKNTVRIPLAAMFHQSQLPAIPFCATNPVTASGVSTANVVATIDVPVSHHGALRPDRKYSPMFLPLPRANHSPMPRLTAKNTTMTATSSGLSCMAVRSCAQGASLRRPKVSPWADPPPRPERRGRTTRTFRERRGDGARAGVARDVRTFLVAVFFLAAAVGGGIRQRAAAQTAAVPALVPQPFLMEPQRCPTPLPLDRSLRFAAEVDRGGFELLRERWTALGIPAPTLATRSDARPDVELLPGPRMGGHLPNAYGLKVLSHGVFLAFGTAESEFDALMTLAQLPERRNAHWIIPCVWISDRPEMRWRIVSDDVSRGPFPTLAYAKERIRTLASLKINGWSPYMEQVLVDPRHPFVAWPNGWPASEL